MLRHDLATKSISSSHLKYIDTCLVQVHQKLDVYLDAKKMKRQAIEIKECHPHIQNTSGHIHAFFNTTERFMSPNKKLLIIHDHNITYTSNQNYNNLCNNLYHNFLIR